VLDEAGSRVHLSHIVVPPEILELEKEIEKIRIEKNQVVKNQDFEEAAHLRDMEKKLQDDLEKAQTLWEEQSKEVVFDVNEYHIADVVSMITGVPVNKIAESESNRLLLMEQNLNNSIIGQEEAISKLAKSIRRARAGLKDPQKPIGTFVFLGPTGVGKTEMAKVLAKFLFDSTEALIRVDMSEFMEKFAVSRLTGAPPGYVGYEEGGQLTEKVRRKPYSVILLDEIEKAHPDVFNILLQVLDDGALTDGLGRKVDFRNTIIIMTSNIGARDIKNIGGFGFSGENEKDQHNAMKTKIDDAVKKMFNPEFLNRLDDTIIFHRLEKKHIFKIIDIQLGNITKRITTLGLTLELSEQAREFLVEKGFDPQFGARPLKRTLQKYLEDPLAEEMLRNTYTDGSKIKVTLNEKDSELTFIEITDKTEIGEVETAENEELEKSSENKTN
jgi:ATP-dependent Clp protease ATP-binding subunit ClpC